MNKKNKDLTLKIKDIISTPVYSWFLLELFITLPKYAMNKQNSISNPYYNKKIFNINPLTRK